MLQELLHQIRDEVGGKRREERKDWLMNRFLECLWENKVARPSTNDLYSPLVVVSLVVLLELQKNMYLTLKIFFGKKSEKNGVQ